MSKFTPGPWAYEFSPDEGFLIVADKVLVIAATAQTEANARLITAAPALYEALKAVLAVANVRIDDARIGVFDAARAALALVGEQT